MNREFISYEEALALKELGFDEPCFTKFESYFDKTKLAAILSTFSLQGPYENEYNGYDQKIINDTEKRWVFTGYKNSVKDHGKEILSAPIFSQAFRFFRENGFGIIEKPFYSSTDIPNITYAKDIIDWETGKVYKMQRQATYEEAELDCLRKLIEIYKAKKDE
jgi:hypothetical protein